MYGVGYDVAAKLLVAAGDNPDRLPSEAAFAHMCGVAPLEASSGKTRRHRLNRGGNRQANNALYCVVITRMASHPRPRPTSPAAAPRASRPARSSASSSATSPAKPSSTSGHRRHDLTASHGGGLTPERPTPSGLFNERTVDRPPTTSARAVTYQEPAPTTSGPSLSCPLRARPLTTQEHRRGACALGSLAARCTAPAGRSPECGASRTATGPRSIPTAPLHRTRHRGVDLVASWAILRQRSRQGLIQASQRGRRIASRQRSYGCGGAPVSAGSRRSHARRWSERQAMRVPLRLSA